MLSRRLLRIKVVKALFAHLKSGADNMMASEKTLMASVDKAYDLYFQILILPVEIARYAEQRQELAKQKKLPTFEDLNPNTKFVDNAVIRTIANSDAVNDHVAARKLGWERYPELIRTLYAQLTESDYYKDYMQREERSFDDDKKLLEDFFKELQSCEALDDVLEEHIRSGADITCVCTPRRVTEEATTYMVDESGAITDVLSRRGTVGGYSALEVYLVSKKLLLQLRERVRM